MAIKQRTKIILSCLGIPFCFLLASYIWVAFGPTGISRVEKELPAAVERLEESLSAVKKTVRPATLSPETVKRVQGDTPVAKIHELATQLRDQNPTIFMLSFTSVPSDTIELLPEEFTIENGRLTPSASALQGVRDVAFAQQGSERKKRQDRVDSQIRWIENPWLEDMWKKDQVVPETPDPAEYRNKIHQTLDQLEYLLLDTDWTPASVQELSHFYYAAGMEDIGRFVLMAVIRASVEKDEDKASRLLGHYIDLLRFGSLHISPAHYRCKGYEAGQFVFNTLGEIDSISLASLTGAAQTLVNSRLRQEELDSVRRYFVDNVREKWLRSTEDGLDSAPSGAPHTGAFGEMRNAALNAFFQPITRNQTDRFMAALANGDTRALDKVVSQSMVVGETMDWLVLNGQSRWGHMDLLRESVDYFEEQIDYGFLRLTLAAACYRKSRGVNPESIEQLVPEFLEQSFIEDEDSGWGICRWETRPVFQPEGHAPDDPIVELYEDFIETHYGSEPSSPEQPVKKCDPAGRF